MTHPYTHFDTVEDGEILGPGGLGKWEEVRSSDEYGMEMFIDVTPGSDLYLEWSIDQDIYLHNILKKFGPEGAGPTWDPLAVNVQFKFVARDPTNGEFIEDFITVVIYSSEETADSDCDWSVLSFLSQLSGGNMLTVPYTVQRDTVYSDATINTRQDVYLLSSLAGVEDLVDCMEFLKITLDLEFEDGWEPIFEMSSSGVDIENLPYLLHESPIVLYEENGIFKLSLDIPQHWFEGTLRLKTQQQGDSITVLARIAIRTVIDDEIVSVAGDELTYQFNIKVTSNGEDSGCGDVVATPMGGVDSLYMAFSASTAGQMSFANATIPSTFSVEGTKACMPTYQLYVEN